MPMPRGRDSVMPLKEQDAPYGVAELFELPLITEIAAANQPLWQHTPQSLMVDEVNYGGGLLASLLDAMAAAEVVS
jgi:hypothetical protein